MKLRAEVTCEQNLLLISDCNLPDHSMDPAALGGQMLRVSVALAAVLLTLVPKLLDGPCLSGMVPGSSPKGLNILKDILSSPS